MKKVMLIVMLVVVCGGCFAADKPETKTEIKVGQVWGWAFLDGVQKNVLEVGEKYIVFHYVSEGDIILKAQTHDGFRRSYELLKQVAVKGATLIWTFDTSDLIASGPPQAKKKPYIHKNPTNDHWICSKHGDLTADLGTWYIGYIAAVGDMKYCYECYMGVERDAIINRTNQHITGVKEND